MTTWRSDDLAQVIIGGDLEHVGYAQGVLREWDADSFENVVDVRGGLLRNLPVAAGVEALTYQAGQVLMLTRWKPRTGGGIATYWVGMGGRVIFPGTGAGSAAVAFMRGTLAKEIAREVLAEGMLSDSVPLIEGTVSNPGSSYVAADGPSLSNIEISESGTCLLFLTARIAAQINQPNGVSAEGWMSFRITGATVVEPADDESLNNGIFGPAADVIVSTKQASRLVLVEGLNPGVHHFEARYRSEHLDPPPDTSVIFSSRNLTVVAL